MNLSVCTISFRHQLISLEQIAVWASLRGFTGIELWGVHASNMADNPDYDGRWLRSYCLSVPMVSDYLPLQGERGLAVQKANELCLLARRWGAQKVRTFAGDRASRDVSREERRAWIVRLRELCQVIESHGLSLVVETHPETLADSAESIVRLIEEVGHPALRINFDVIHVWESGADPCLLLDQLEPLVAHMHLKNIRARKQLHEFAPANVYAPAGNREGMVRLFDGQFDFERFLRHAMEKPTFYKDVDASLEWFGKSAIETLEHDFHQVRMLEAATRNVAQKSPLGPSLTHA